MRLLRQPLRGFLAMTIRWYQKYISPYKLYRCRYYPSCSEYTIEAIEHRGAVVGLVKGLARIVRCNPLLPGGYDPYLETGSSSKRKQVPRSH